MLPVVENRLNTEETMVYMVGQPNRTCQCRRNVGMNDADLSQDLNRMTRNVYIFVGVFLASSIAISALLFWPRSETLGERLYRSL